MIPESNKARMKRLRAAFRQGVFLRDGNQCRVCGRKSDLDAHHISDRRTMPNDGYAVSNGITLCGDVRDACHLKAEVYHMSGGSHWEEGFHPDDLYGLVGSSREQAERDSRALA